MDGAQRQDSLCLRLDGFRYRRAAALGAVEFNVSPGERVILLGPNGAGKSTLLKLLAGVLPIRRGQARVAGEQAGLRRLRREVALMPQDIQAIPRLTVTEQVSYAHWLGGRARHDRASEVDTAIRLARLEAQADRPVQDLSGGQRRRLGLAECLARDTAFVLLDEPTAGLDPQQRGHFRSALDSLDGRAVVVATHETRDVATAFSRVCVIVDGLVVFDDSMAAFLAQDPERHDVDAAYSAIVQGSGG